MFAVNRIAEDGLFIEQVIIEEGQTVPDGCISIPVPEGFYHPKWDVVQWVEGNPPSLDSVKTAKIAELDALCNQTILAGFTSTALGELHEYDFDYEAQQNLAGALSLFNADATLTEITWKTKDAGPLLHTKEHFLQLYKDGFNFKNSNIGKYWTLKQQVLTATEKEIIESIQW